MKYIADLQMDTRVQVQLSVESDPSEIDTKIQELIGGLKEDGATNVELISCSPMVEVQSRAVN